MEEPMRRSAALILTALMIALTACYSRQNSALISSESTPAASTERAQVAAAEDRMATTANAPRSSVAGPVQTLDRREGLQGQQQQVPLDSAGAAQAFMRKVIQNAEMTIETDKPSEGQQKIGVIAE